MGLQIIKIVNSLSTRPDDRASVEVAQFKPFIIVGSTAGKFSASNLPSPGFKISAWSNRGPTTLRIHGILSVLAYTTSVTMEPATSVFQNYESTQHLGLLFSNIEIIGIVPIARGTLT